MFYSAEELLTVCHELKAPIWKATLITESENSHLTESELLAHGYEAWKVMQESSQVGLEEPVYSLSGMTGGDAAKLYEYASTSSPLVGANLLKSMAMALSTSETNAAMGRIVAAPTAGASGILPATLMTLSKQHGFEDSRVVESLFTASAIGQIVASKASIAGATGGCQAECGTAAAMAAAASAEICGATPEMVLDAASFALINIMGLVCDPVAGLVEFPCALRNASGTMNALISADMALAGMKSLIPFDEVVDAMKEVGQDMSPTLRETALGGLAITPTGCLLKKTYMPDL